MEGEEKFSLNKMWRKMGKPCPYNEFCEWYNKTNKQVLKVDLKKDIVLQKMDLSTNNDATPLLNPAGVDINADTPIISTIGTGNNVWVAIGVSVAILTGVYLLFYKKTD